MLIKKISLFAAILLAIAPGILAQKNKQKQKGEPTSLTCPFEHGSGREPKEAFTWDPPDQKVIMVSQIDTNIRACIDGEVLKVSSTENDKYEIVIAWGDYYFWYYNVEKPLINERQMVKAGQVIGIYKFGTELEFRMFKEVENDDPAMMDPRNLLECKVPKAE